MSSAVRMPLSATMRALAGQQVASSKSEFGADREGAQIAAVDADEVEAEVDGASNLLAVVGLAEDVEADGSGLRRGVAEGVVGVGGDDEQDGVGSGGAGFEDLKGVEDEVLAEAGNVDSGGGGCEVVEGALEEFLIGKDGEGGGAGGLEGAGEWRGGSRRG